MNPKTIGGILTSDAGVNTVFQLRLDGEEAKKRHVMIRDHQDDPVTGTLVHVDFIRVDMDQTVQVDVPLETVGVSEGVKTDGGLMDFVVRSVQISCMPADIPGHIAIEVESMGIGDVFRVKDLPEDPKIQMLTDPEQALVVINAKAAEEEVAETVEGAVPEGEAEEAPADEAEAPAEEKKE